MDTLQLGKIIEPGREAQRDAIHMAVAPAMSGDRLLPGMPVAFRNLLAVQANMEDALGVVDPFLSDWVKPGEIFWLFLKPGTITKLRHQWQHWAFPSEPPPPPPPLTPQQQSRLWIEQFASSILLDYDVIMDGAADYLRKGEYLCFGALLEGEYVPDEFWTHYETVIGTSVPEEHRGSFFTCSC